MKYASSRKWEERHPAVSVAIKLGAAVDVALKVYALVDLAKRPEAEINGSKEAWVPALVLVNSLGLLPCAYLRWGRRSR